MIMCLLLHLSMALAPPGPRYRGSRGGFWLYLEHLHSGDRRESAVIDKSISGFQSRNSHQNWHFCSLFFRRCTVSTDFKKAFFKSKKCEGLLGARLRKEYELYTFRGGFLFPYFLLLSLCPMGGDERTSFSRTPDTTTSSFSLFFFSCPRGTPSPSSLLPSPRAKRRRRRREKKK